MGYPRVQPVKPLKRRVGGEGQTRSAKFMNGKLAEVCRNLKPFQSLEFDPQQGLVVIITELVMPASDEAAISEILLRNCGTAKIFIRRFADSYKVSISRHIRL